MSGCVWRGSHVPSTRFAQLHQTHQVDLSNQDFMDQIQQKKSCRTKPKLCTCRNKRKKAGALEGSGRKKGHAWSTGLGTHGSLMVETKLLKEHPVLIRFHRMIHEYFLWEVSGWQTAGAFTSVKAPFEPVMVIVWTIWRKGLVVNLPKNTKTKKRSKPKKTAFTQKNVFFWKSRNLAQVGRRRYD